MTKPLTKEEITSYYQAFELWSSNPDNIKVWLFRKKMGVNVNEHTYRIKLAKKLGLTTHKPQQNIRRNKFFKKAYQQHQQQDCMMINENCKIGMGYA